MSEDPRPSAPPVRPSVGLDEMAPVDPALYQQAIRRTHRAFLSTPRRAGLTGPFSPMPAAPPAPKEPRIWLTHSERKAAGLPMKAGFIGTAQRRRAAKQAARDEAKRNKRTAPSASSAVVPTSSVLACPSTPPR